MQISSFMLGCANLRKSVYKKDFAGQKSNSHLGIKRLYTLMQTDKNIYSTKWLGEHTTVAVLCTHARVPYFWRVFTMQ